MDFHRYTLSQFFFNLNQCSVSDKHCAFAVAAILQFPVVHKKRPPKMGYRRTKINRMKLLLLIKILQNFFTKFSGMQVSATAA